MRICDIDWGDDSAEKDPNLLNYFVESEALQRILNKRKNLVIGIKGSGKSALRRKAEDKFMEEKDTLVISITPQAQTIFNILNGKDEIHGYSKEIFFQYIWLRHIFTQSLYKAGHQFRGWYVNKSATYARQLSRQANTTSSDLVESITEIVKKLKIKAGNLGDLGLSVESELKNATNLNDLEYHFKEIANNYFNFVIF